MNRALRTKEKRIHRHLYLAMLIQVVIRLILYVDQGGDSIDICNLGYKLGFE